LIVTDVQVCRIQCFVINWWVLFLEIKFIAVTRLYECSVCVCVRAHTAVVFEATWSVYTQLCFRVLQKYVFEILRFGCGAAEVLRYYSLSQGDWYPMFRLVFKGSGVLGRFDPVTCGSCSPRRLRLLFGERV